MLQYFVDVRINEQSSCYRINFANLDEHDMSTQETYSKYQYVIIKTSKVPTKQHNNFSAVRFCMTFSKLNWINYKSEIILLSTYINNYTCPWVRKFYEKTAIFPTSQYPNKQLSKCIRLLKMYESYKMVFLV